MKAARLPYQKCTPGRGNAHGGQCKPAAHVPARRAVGAPLQRFDDNSGGGQPAAVSLVTQPIEPLVLHGAPGNIPHVLHIDNDSAAAEALALLLMPEARVTHAPTLAAARALLRKQVFSVVVLDPDLPDGDAAELLPALAGTPLLVYSATPPAWRGQAGVFLSKPWTSPRLLWTTISMMLCISTPTSAGA